MLGDKLRAARERTGLTQGQFAALLGIDRNTVNRIECDRGNPRVTTLAAWARLCGVSLDDLIGATADTASPAVNSADVEAAQ